MNNENLEEERRAQNPEDDEISLIDLLAVLLRHKWLIIITTVLAMIFAVAYSAISSALPPEKSETLSNLYTAKALMHINSANNGNFAEYLVETNSFLNAVIDEFDLETRFETEKPSRAEIRNALKKLISAEFDGKTSVFSLSFTDKDLEFAKNVVNFSVSLIENMFLKEKKNLEQEIDNSYKEILNLQKKIQDMGNSVSYSSANPSVMSESSMLRLELEVQKEVYTQLKILKIEKSSETPVFQVIAEAEAEAGLGRGKLIIIITFAAFFISVFIAFALNAIENIRNDPVAMEKLRGGNKK